VCASVRCLSCAGASAHLCAAARRGVASAECECESSVSSPREKQSGYLRVRLLRACVRVGCIALLETRHADHVPDLDLELETLQRERRADLQLAQWVTQPRTCTYAARLATGSIKMRNFIS
jgi:hypothetical protein